MTTTSGLVKTITLPHDGVELGVHKSLSCVMYKLNGVIHDVDLRKRAHTQMSLDINDMSWHTNFNQVIDGVNIIYIDKTKLAHATVAYTAIVSTINPDDDIALIGVGIEYRSDKGGIYSEIVDLDLASGETFKW